MSDIGKALAPKNGHTDIAFLANAYREAEAAYKKWAEATRVHAAQLLVTEASGDKKALEAVKAQKPYTSSQFVEIYRRRKDSAKSLVEALGIDVSDLRDALL